MSLFTQQTLSIHCSSNPLATLPRVYTHMLPSYYYYVPLCPTPPFSFVLLLRPAWRWTTVTTRS
jgi:hypothetical protein